MPGHLSVRDLEVRGKRVFGRVDFNVPLEEGRIVDDTRITASLPTIHLLLERGARLLLASHLGRPKGTRTPTMSLAPAASRLSELLGFDVPLAPDCIGPEVAALAAALPPGRALLLENLRFHAGEEKNSPDFSEQLASLADLYVNDAFGTAHRAHASTVGVPARLSRSAAGLLMDAELLNLAPLLEGASRPYVAILGGAKVSDKIDLIRSLRSRVDAILIGGAMAYTFLEAAGVAVGSSRVERDRIDTARGLVGEARDAGIELLLPSDHRVRLAGGEIITTPGAAIPEGATALDIGPATIRAFSSRIAGARTILWNGPVGLFEEAPFDAGSRAIADAIASSSAHSVAGGGDTAAAVRAFGLTERFTHVSTGGGATLEFLSGLPLPGVDALSPSRGGSA